MIKSFSVQVKTKNAYDLAKLIAYSSGVMKDLNEDKTPEGISRYENIEELLNAIKEFSDKPREFNAGDEPGKEESEVAAIRTLDEFMQDVALITDADVQDKDSGDKVSLMTIHAAKGLEFPYVYIVGLEENLFPSIQSLGSRADLEEERRLFYVALTRAEKKVHISYSESRYRWGNLTISEPSRFIDEINSNFIAFPQRANMQKMTNTGFTEQRPVPIIRKNLKKIGNFQSGPPSSESGASSSPIELIIPGAEVEHARFGRGKVISVEGAGASRKAAVFFKNVGQKQLLLQYAKLKVVL
jgi:DNA helicase-2/ATP-dependent DNA helicase PcrA